MSIDEKFTWGQYKNLTLRQVYQGTSNIDRVLLGEFLNSCWNSDYFPKFIEAEFFETFMILENEIIVVPEIFNEDKPKQLDNIISLGDLSEKLSNYFNLFFGKSAWEFDSNIRKFNRKYFQYVIGGDPEYLEYCLKKNNGFKIDYSTKLELQKLEVNAFIGIKITLQNKNSYSYKPLIKKYYYTFKS